MERKLFGTDGIRGEAGKEPLDPATVFAVGVALGRFLRKSVDDPKVLIGMDTRESGPWIARHVAAGLTDSGATVRFAGLISTPGVAYLTRTGDFAAGVMISASHNPFQDNGIKVLSHSGYKFPDAQEHAVEQEIFSILAAGVHPREISLEADPGLDERYLEHLALTMPVRLDGLRLVVDCANGAVSGLAPELFSRLGASVDALGAMPDGRNINLGCGALHTENLQREVVRTGADAGIAFDGDADRSLFVSESGRLIDGDEILWVAGRYLHERKHLATPAGDVAVIATVMSNLGLERGLADSGIRLIRTSVGDKYVIEEMVRLGAKLGGEQSGHIIFHEYATTGDGMLTALRVLEIMRATGRTLDQLTQGFVRYPQILINVRVKEKRPLETLPTVQSAVRTVEEQFGERGRVLVRYSGTEALARVMVEGPEEGAVHDAAHRIRAALEQDLGPSAA